MGSKSTSHLTVVTFVLVSRAGAFGAVLFVSSVAAVGAAVAHPLFRNARSAGAALEVVLRTLERVTVLTNYYYNIATIRGELRLPLRHHR